jgi:hypothetical protein
MAFVTSMREPAPKSGCERRARGVWCDHPGQRRREHEGVGRPIYIMSRELELVAGRLCDSPGCVLAGDRREHIEHHGVEGGEHAGREPVARRRKLPACRKVERDDADLPCLKLGPELAPIRG